MGGFRARRLRTSNCLVHQECFCVLPVMRRSSLHINERQDMPQPTADSGRIDVPVGDSLDHLLVVYCFQLYLPRRRKEGRCVDNPGLALSALPQKAIAEANRQSSFPRGMRWRPPFAGSLRVSETHAMRQPFEGRLRRQGGLAIWRARPQICRLPWPGRAFPGRRSLPLP